MGRDSHGMKNEKPAFLIRPLPAKPRVKNGHRNAIHVAAKTVDF